MEYLYGIKPEKINVDQAISDFDKLDKHHKAIFFGFTNGKCNECEYTIDNNYKENIGKDKYKLAHKHYIGHFFQQEGILDAIKKRAIYYKIKLKLNSKNFDDYICNTLTNTNFSNVFNNILRKQWFVGYRVYTKPTPRFLLKKLLRDPHFGRLINHLIRNFYVDQLQILPKNEQPQWVKDWKNIRKREIIEIFKDNNWDAQIIEFSKKYKTHEEWLAHVDEFFNELYSDDKEFKITVENNNYVITF